MQDAWCLVVSDPEARAAEVINLYGERWGIETTFRDTKDHNFGLGMAHVHTTSPARRDRLFMLSALTIALPTMLGAAGNSICLERTHQSEYDPSELHIYRAHRSQDAGQ